MTKLPSAYVHFEADALLDLADVAAEFDRQLQALGVGRVTGTTPGWHVHTHFLTGAVSRVDCIHVELGDLDTCLERLLEALPPLGLGKAGVDTVDDAGRHGIAFPGGRG